MLVIPRFKIMVLAKKREETKKDERARAVENNPCSICRSLGLPFCRGHGGGSGGGGSDSTSDDKLEGNDHQLLAPKDPANVPSIDQLLLHSGLWHLPEDADFVFEFKDPLALVNMTLNMELGFLVLQGKRELSNEEQKALDELFDTIKQEFNLFKNSIKDPQFPLETMTLAREGNSLTIKIPSPKYYDLFVQQLMDKNLLPGNAPVLQHQNQSVKHPEKLGAVMEKDSAKEEYKSFLPNPFDISRGPKLPDWV
ncbi:TPA: hypothetical protein RG395_001707 [Legionella pneumophila]|uniref:hypothetical protein n=1 Tax=Legionella pneumophila TaxID=446 RepID=UPI0009B543E5|nr:hypothetical protein [Legionella pneumophila]MDW9166782.1 hypothetical protein [Legionella pneumophila subsp. fraseri]MDX1847687.1 hypothetical protein [Legionella pneumophila subsp. fraseri]HAT1771388.1 hypothetical protein [Legionella pneumophila]HAT1846810.1 hypothetical protein [Legionella pneumophila]HAT1859930.1 hypothetical protein [Legionella pneumophila]